MKINSNNIIFADLSTYTPKKSMQFYERVFGWNYYESDNYYSAFIGNKQVTGLYETPERFKQMRMPHFWMTYIQVNDINTCVKNAKALGGIIELEQTIGSFGKVALIRDPKGTGFTVYEGEYLKSTKTEKEINTLIWNELHVSNLTTVIPFYEGIFNWRFQSESNGLFNIYTAEQEHIADALEVKNEYKGKYEYWACVFGVSNLDETSEKILKNEGNLILDEGNRRLFTDNSGQAFFYIKDIKGRS
ncbi:VOC family protein [Seonamhaeicola marinus]|uniref:VOC domain-containing protein n=1 Tax=Seonamhaeicola marinus TaxID=1912246 RepID=A0A5D0HJB0_9FLAO|nr:VOC family protein [Seonamhaeicola marinus]TYA71391.1 hypothetical protein FUA24_17560 [Seonamhaeicola marinus]